jgi:O-antigen/teichoic acid export membrane protein
MSFLPDKIDSFYSKYYKDSTLLKRFAHVFSLDVLVRASNLILLPVYLKLMTQDEFGLYGYLLSIIGIFSLVLNFGLYLAQIKLYHDFLDDRRRSLIFTINITLLVFLFIVLLPVYMLNFDKQIISLLFLHPINYESYRSVLFLAILVSVYVFMLQNFFIASENIKKYQLYNLCKLIFVNSIVIYLLAAKDGDSVMVRLKYGYLIELLILISFSFFYINQMKMDFSFELVPKALRIGLPAMLSALLGVIYNFSDKFILEKYGNFSDLAIYNLGFTIAGIIMIIFSSFQTVFLPFFFKEKDIKKNFNKTKEIVLRMVIIFFVISIVLIAFTKMALYLKIIESKYDTVFLILPVLLLTQIFQSAVHMFSNYIVYFEVVYIGTIVVFFLSILNISLNLLLIPRYNIYGAALSSLIITVLTLVFYYNYTKRKCHELTTSQKTWL